MLFFGKWSKLRLRDLVMVALLITAAPGQERWQIAGLMPVPVAGAQVFSDSQQIYLLGGYTNPLDIAGSTLDIIQTYDPQQNLWGQERVTLNAGRAGFAGGWFEGAFHFAGGVMVANGTPFAYFGIERWERPNDPVLTNFNPEFNRINTTGLVLNGRLYLIGGQPAIVDPTFTLSYIVEYDLVTAAITFVEDSLFQGQDMPYHQSAMAVGEDIFIFGGARFGVSRRVYRFNTQTHDFQEIVSMSSERAGGASVEKAPGEILLIGGYNESPFNTAMDSVILYNTADPVPPFPQVSLNVGRREASAVRFGQRIYLFGGVNSFNFTEANIEFLDLATGISGGDPQPLSPDFALHPNYPNPFNGETRIEVSLKRAGPLQLAIFDVSGRKVRQLANGFRAAGSHEFAWDGRDERGLPVGSGVYFYRLRAPGFQDVKKMMLVQ